MTSLLIAATPAVPAMPSGITAQTSNAITPPIPPHPHVVVVQKIVMYSPAYFTACAIGGALSCGMTHALVTPIDLVKCNQQVNAHVFKGGAVDNLRALYAGRHPAYGSGVRALYRGVVPTLVGYSVQGAYKFGLYEYYKHLLIAAMDPISAVKYRDLVYVSASASAEFVADFFLCPMEAVKVRVQTMPTYARGLMDGITKMVRVEGWGALYAGLVPLWARQVPYTVIKFASFERIASGLFALSSTPKEAMSKPKQLSFVFTAGYLAGILCGVATHPADVLVSAINKAHAVGSLLERSRLIVNGDTAKGIVGIGMRGLWAGLGPRVFMIGTLTGLQWLIYGAFKAQIGLPTPGDVVVRVIK